MYDPTAAFPRSHSAEVSDAYAEIHYSEISYDGNESIESGREDTPYSPPGELLSLTQVY